MNKNILKVILIGVVVLFLGAVVFLFSKSRVMVVRTDRSAYERGERMRVFIQNRFWNKELCLSSCYPYFLEKKDGDWDQYRYAACPSEDRVSVCLSPRESKTFETSVPPVSPGLHRISVPVCEDCNLGTVFYEEGQFSSQDFEIK